MEAYGVPIVILHPDTGEQVILEQLDLHNLPEGELIGQELGVVLRVQ